tara:strand:- start:377 stop:571 length:195 start_codon:yes stop_codon:yes gene_type:complete
MSSRALNSLLTSASGHGTQSYTRTRTRATYTNATNQCRSGAQSGNSNIHYPKKTPTPVQHWHCR